MKFIDNKVKKSVKNRKPLFPKPVNPNDKKAVNQWADEMIKYGKSISKYPKKLILKGKESHYSQQIVIL